jgi:glyoxylase-like metal-dependent hydrolase (beta-lactamase superfamily II)
MAGSCQKKNHHLYRRGIVSVEIYSKRVGINRCYLIKADGCIMVDTGPPKSARAIEKWLFKIPFDPHEIQLIVLTHGHPDHVGAAQRIKDFTGAKIALHKDDQYMIENWKASWPTAVCAWGHVLGYLSKLFQPLLRYASFKTDLIIGDEGLSLKEYEIGRASCRERVCQYV